MKSRYPMRALRIPAVLGGVTAFALLAALLDDGFIEIVSIVLLASLVGLVGLHIVKGFKPARPD